MLPRSLCPERRCCRPYTKPSLTSERRNDYAVLSILGVMIGVCPLSPLCSLFSYRAESPRLIAARCVVP